MNNKRKETLITLCLISIVIIGILLDNGIIYKIPKQVLIDTDMNQSLRTTVFSAQVTIATLGIALISILGVLLKERIYGIDVLKYLTNDKPLIFKHKRCIITNLILIAISYIMMSLNYYNTLVCLFFISITINIIMVNDVFVVYRGTVYLKKDIDKYIEYIFKNKKLDDDREEIIINLRNHTLDNIESNNIYIINENLEKFREILTYIRDYDNQDNKKMLIVFEEKLGDIFNKIFEDKDDNKVFLAIKVIQDIYKDCNDFNKSNDNKIYLDIFETVYYRVFSAIAELLIADREDQFSIINIQYDIYNNMSFREVDGNFIIQNNQHMYLYSSRIYYEMKRKGFDKYNSDALFNIKIELFEYLNRMITYYNFNGYMKEQKIDQVYIQLYYYTQTLIDNNEQEILKDTFIEEINEYKHDEKKHEYILGILMYLYYTIEFEELVDTNLKNQLRGFISKYESLVSHYLLYNCNYTFSKEKIFRMKKILSRLEKSPEKKRAKWMLMDGVIETFTLLYNLEKNSTLETLTHALKPIVLEREFQIYSNVYNQDIEAKYISFIKLFYREEINEKEVRHKIELLKKAIEELYKQSEMTKVSRNISKLEKVESGLEEKIYNLFETKLSIFNNKVEGKTENKNIKLLNLTTSIDFLKDDDLEQIKEICYDRLVIAVIQMIIHNIKYKKMCMKDKNLLKSLFELNSELEFETNTLVGYRSVFFREDAELFKEFEKGKFIIKSNKINDCILIIDSNKMYFNIKDINVSIDKLDIDNICKELSKNEKDEYLYNITNDIYLPFTKEELKSYLDNNKRCIKVSAKIEYMIYDQIIGCGVIEN